MTLRRKPIDKIKKGNEITAKYLNTLGDSINDLQAAFQGPKQLNEPPPAAVQNQTETDDDEPASPNTYVETNRTTTTVQIFDQNDENYAEIERIETISFANSEGETLTLRFNN
jgi:hypothetical protein